VNRLISDAIASLIVNPSFRMEGEIVTEQDYIDNVIFSDPSKKPSWEAVQAQVPVEKWVFVRAKRDAKLQSCDWTMLSDVPLDPSVKTEWETYRQALRDITDQSDPFNIVWPTPPA